MKQTRGQALVEWTIFALAVMILWVTSIQMATRLLARVSVESWSMIGARQALSNAETRHPFSMLVTKQSRTRSGHAVAVQGGAQASARVALPANPDPLSSRLSSFGFRSSRSLE